jgi:CheY-like chemotaxis protein
MTPCKILIIDDDRDDVEILADAFQKCGVEAVHYVYSAMEAFIYLQSLTEKENLPRLIVTDMYLPGITGAEFLIDLKNMELYKDIYVIVLSSTKSEREIGKALSLGAKDYLVKPYTYDEYVKVAADMKRKAGL